MTLGKISKKYHISKSSVQWILKNYSKQHLKTGRKPKLSKYDKRKMQTILSNNNKAGIKCSAKDIVQFSQLNISTRTAQRVLKSLKFKYSLFKKKYQLSKGQKQKRVEVCKDFLINNIQWDKVIFSDEKSFTLAGCDTYYCWIQQGKHPKRIKRLLNSPKLMIWGMILPNGLLTYRIMRGKQKSMDYVEIMKNSMLPIMKMNYPPGILFQQDNAPIHCSNFTKNYLRNENIITLPWPANSPDLNIIENVWSVLSQDIYRDGELKNLYELESRIAQAVKDFNEKRKEYVDNLYDSIRRRLISVIVKRGDRIKY